MATLVLTALGTAIGGPIGGALGAVLGQTIDQNVLFAPKPRHGPRLGELAVQTSSYGSAIPKLFGTMRVAGTVIWSTDLIERRSTHSNGKGQPKTVNYSYSASFAVALSGRAIRSVGRIWADGKLLRGAAGDFKSATDFRLYLGDEDQAVDPLIASAEGAGEAPAFRGVAYALFEDFQLADYGNRIPSLTFEVEADEGPVTIGAIAAALGGIAAGETPALHGYAASGDSVRGAIEGLADIAPLSLIDDGETLTLSAGTEAAAALDPAAERDRREIARRGAGAMPAEISITYYEVGRDYQAGLQRASAGEAPARLADRRALPAALDAAAAKALAEHRLAWAWAERTSAKTTACWRAAAIRPGQLLTLAGEAGAWRVRRLTLGPMTVELELARAARNMLPGSATASPGAPVAQPDLVHGPTLLHLLDLPLGDAGGGRPLLHAAAAGSGEGWRRAALEISFDGGASWTAAGDTAAPAVLGTAIDALPAAGPALFDARHEVEVELAHAGMWLESRDDDALVGGANAALLGEEIVQFGAAEPLGGNRFRLSRLLRGRRGTEWAAELHAAGERFVLLEAESLAALEAPAGSLGGSARLLATGVGDLPDAAEASAAITGAALRPPSPAHLRTAENGAGDLLISWTRRSRLGWAWTDDGDAPLGEELESYRLEISGPGFVRIVSLATPFYLYAAADRLADGAAEALSVAQLGTWAASRPATLPLS